MGNLVMSKTKRDRERDEVTHARRRTGQSRIAAREALHDKARKPGGPGERRNTPKTSGELIELLAAPRRRQRPKRMPQRRVTCSLHKLSVKLHDERAEIYWCKAAHGFVYSDDVVADEAGQRFCFVHGDSLAADDYCAAAHGELSLSEVRLF